MNPYKVLGVSPYSSPDERKHAYHELIKKYHPDVDDSVSAKHHLANIVDAWTILETRQSKSMIYRITVALTHKELAESLGKTLDIDVDNMLLSIKVPYNTRMGDTIVIKNSIKILVTIKEKNEQQQSR
jgi:hypothetical protein